jgi:uncharacterized membrane protein YeaQ/YmgE (transglycosylase-associated protein family)
LSIAAYRSADRARAQTSGTAAASTQVIMDIITWLIVGLVAGVLASMVVGSGFGILGDIIVGIVGAFIGGWLFVHQGWHAPIEGLGGTILVAFIGSVILLVILRIIRSATGGPRVV